MKLKRIFSVGASVFLLLPSLSALAGCGAQETVRLRIYNWEEYIDEGGSACRRRSDCARR